jgi:hypothetical protein
MFADIQTQPEQAFCSEVLEAHSRNQVLRALQPLLENWILLARLNGCSGLTEQVLMNKHGLLPPTSQEMYMFADNQTHQGQAFCSEALVHS